MKKAFVLGVLAFFAINIMSVQNLNAQKLPELKTGQVTEITSNSAVVYCVVASDGGSKVTERGVCWGLKKQPTVNENKVANNEKTAEFKAKITDLKPATTYYVRAYAKNSDGLSYGPEVSFTTSKATQLSANEATFNNNNISKPKPKLDKEAPKTISRPKNYSDQSEKQKPGAGKDTGKVVEKKAPEVKTVTVNNITKDGIICIGEIVSEGNPKAIDYGVCWSTKSMPTLNDNKTTPIQKSNKFEVHINNLKPDTQYYLRAYAKNDVGVSYGEEIAVKTQGKAQTVRPRPSDKKNDNRN